MQDFVNGNYEAEPFFDGHDWNNPKPKTPDECKELFERSSEMIKKRTKRMVDALIAKKNRQHYEKAEQNRREKRITGDNQWRNEN